MLSCESRPDAWRVVYDPKKIIHPEIMFDSFYLKKKTQKKPRKNIDMVCTTYALSKIISKCFFFILCIKWVPRVEHFIALKSP